MQRISTHDALLHPLGSEDLFNLAQFVLFVGNNLLVEHNSSLGFIQAHRMHFLLIDWQMSVGATQSFPIKSHMLLLFRLSVFRSDPCQQVHEHLVELLSIGRA